MRSCRSGIDIENWPSSARPSVIKLLEITGVFGNIKRKLFSAPDVVKTY
jgi:hypothetical protein